MPLAYPTLPRYGTDLISLRSHFHTVSSGGGTSEFPVMQFSCTPSGKSRPRSLVVVEVAATTARRVWS